MTNLEFSQEIRKILELKLISVYYCLLFNFPMQVSIIEIWTEYYILKF